jgi:hypothetical protein
MKVIILNGNPDTSNHAFDDYLKNLSEALTATNHDVTILTLRDMDIRYCVGCWGCWVKTPGECVALDESADVRRAYINSDFVLFTSPVIMGFTSALLKKAQEKLLPILLPYFEHVNDELRHVGRYSRYPAIGLLLEKSRTCDDEDIKIISDIYGRFAINVKTDCRFTKLTSDPVKEVADEINHL